MINLCTIQNYKLPELLNELSFQNIQLSEKLNTYVSLAIIEHKVGPPPVPRPLPNKPINKPSKKFPQNTIHEQLSFN